MGLFTKKNTASRQTGIRGVIEALMQGRTLSIYDSKEFKEGEMHTVFCKIRRKISRGLIQGYVLRDEWHTNENGVRYKCYWFDATE